MNSADYLGVFRHHWKLIVGLIIVGTAVAALASVLQKPKYDATAESFVSTSSASSASDLFQGSNFTQQVVKSYADVATKSYVLNQVIAKLRLTESAEELSKRVTANAPADTVIIQITAEDPSPAAAARLADAVSLVLSQRVGELAPDSSAGVPSVVITQVQPAPVPTYPSSPRTLLNVLIGALGGLFLGFALPMLRERLNTRVRSRSEVESLVGKPLLGSTFFDASAQVQPLVMITKPSSGSAEAYRSLQTNLHYLKLGNQKQSFVVTSALPSEGKSTTSANLAMALASTGRTTLLIDADLRRPKLSDYFGVDGSAGLSDLIVGDLSASEAIQTLGEYSLAFLPSGAIPPNPIELLQSNAMGEVIAQLGAQFDTIILDAPPLLPVSDAAIIAKNTDGAVLVAAVNRVKKTQLQQAVSTLERIDATILGIVATMIKTPRNDQYGYQYSGSYSPQGNEVSPTVTQVRDAPTARSSAS